MHGLHSIHSLNSIYCMADFTLHYACQVVPTSCFHEPVCMEEKMNRLQASACGMTLALAASVIPVLLPAHPGSGNHPISNHPSVTDSEKAIQAVLNAQLLAWNRGDIEGFMDG